VTTGDQATASAGPSVPVFVQARLDNGGAPTSSGLALIGWNLDVTPAGGAADADLCDTGGFLVMAPVGMNMFDRKNASGPGFNNLGLTNPSSSPNLSGYSGTCDGVGGLLQLGGGQNSIGNTPGGAPYPIGDSSGAAGVQIVQGVGNTNWVTIAEGDIDASSLSGAQSWTLAVNTVFANTINNGQSVAPYAVTEATQGAHASLVISAGVNCHPSDVNCDGSANALDVAVITNAANWLLANPACDRADAAGNGSANALDVAVVTNAGNWLQIKTPPGGPASCNCVTNTPANCPNVP
jgi:hypothetical protein